MGMPNTVMLTLEVACSIIDQLAKRADEKGISLHEYVMSTMQKAAQDDIKRAVRRGEKNNRGKKQP